MTQPEKKRRRRPPPKLVRVAAVDHIDPSRSTERAYAVAVPGAAYDSPGAMPARVYIPKKAAVIFRDIPGARFERCIWVKPWFANRAGLRELPNPPKVVQ